MILQLLYGPVTAAREAAGTDDVAQIHALSNPPLTELVADDIHVRRCRLAGDAVDSQFGCFRSHDLPKLLDLTHGAPALIGHNRQSVAVARFFGGSVEEFGGHRYIVPKFYWPKAHSAAEDFRVLLDAGIVSEASIAFTFEKPSCSICGKDVRECEHEVGAHYGLKLCHYYYDGIDRVLEGSFVYRGAEPGTGILAEISDLKRAIKGRKTITVRIGGRTYEAIAPLLQENPKLQN
ncbi:hypothetical protein KKH27_07880 [bacterium]|nr:hypothetical protein [bacterium]MBU1983234.1 hypothetical protein [bacterium]